MYNFLFWVGIQLILLWLLALTTKSYRNKRAFKFLFFMPLLLEGAARSISCFLSTVQVKKVDFFENDKPFLTEGNSRVPYIGPVVFLAIWFALLFIGFYIWTTNIQGFNGYVAVGEVGLTLLLCEDAWRLGEDLFLPHDSM